MKTMQMTKTKNYYHENIACLILKLNFNSSGFVRLLFLLYTEYYAWHDINFSVFVFGSKNCGKLVILRFCNVETSTLYSDLKY